RRLRQLLDRRRVPTQARYQKNFAGRISSHQGSLSGACAETLGRSRAKNILLVEFLPIGFARCARPNLEHVMCRKNFAGRISSQATDGLYQRRYQPRSRAEEIARSQLAVEIASSLLSLAQPFDGTRILVYKR